MLMTLCFGNIRKCGLFPWPMGDIRVFRSSAYSNLRSAPLVISERELFQASVGVAMRMVIETSHQFKSEGSSVLENLGEGQEVIPYDPENSTSHLGASEARYFCRLILYCL